MGDTPHLSPSSADEKGLLPPLGDMTTQLYTILSQNMTTELPVPQDSVNTCDVIDTNFDIAISVICAVCFVIGILYTFCGKYVYDMYCCFCVQVILTYLVVFGDLSIFVICVYPVYAYNKRKYIYGSLNLIYFLI